MCGRLDVGQVDRSTPKRTGREQRQDDRRDGQKHRPDCRAVSEGSHHGWSALWQRVSYERGSKTSGGREHTRTWEPHSRDVLHARKRLDCGIGVSDILVRDM